MRIHSRSVRHPSFNVPKPDTSGLYVHGRWTFRIEKTADPVKSFRWIVIHPVSKRIDRTGRAIDLETAIFDAIAWIDRDVPKWD